MAVPNHKGKEVLIEITESADKFLDLVRRKFDLHLDYSEESLVLADELLTLFFKERRSHWDLATAIVGSYFGEVIIKNLGGRWEIPDLTVVKIGKEKGIAEPLRLARKRLARGMEDSLVCHYLRIKMQMCHSGEFAGRMEKVEKYHETLRKGGWDNRLFMRMTDENEKTSVREEAAHLLGKISDGRISDHLLHLLEDPSMTYFACIAFQGAPDKRAFSRLLELACEGEDQGTRIQAIQALGELEDSRAVTHLVKMLAEEEEFICHYASQALGRIGGELALQLTLDILSCRRPGKKVYAIGALELIGDPASVPSLIEALFDRNEEIREAATRAFQYIPDPRALGPLLFSLQDPSSKIRILAAYALTHIGDPKALSPMKKLLKDPVQCVRDHGSYLIPLLENKQKPAGFCW